MDIKPIRNENDYKEALQQIERLMGAQRNTVEGNHLDALVTLIEDYERKNYPQDLLSRP